MNKICKVSSEKSFKQLIIIYCRLSRLDKVEKLAELENRQIRHFFVEIFYDLEVILRKVLNCLREKKTSTPYLYYSYNQQSAFGYEVRALYMTIIRYSCDQCNKTFKNAEYVKQHVRVAHKKIKDHKCVECGKEFTQHGSLQLHIRMVHQKLRNYLCRYVEKWDSYTFIVSFTEAMKRAKLL